MWFAERFEAGGEHDVSAATGAGGRDALRADRSRARKLLSYRQWAESPDAGSRRPSCSKRSSTGPASRSRRPDSAGRRASRPQEVHHGMDETLDDLILYLEHGVHFARHRDVKARADSAHCSARCPGGLRSARSRRFVRRPTPACSPATSSCSSGAARCSTIRTCSSSSATTIGRRGRCGLRPRRRSAARPGPAE